MRLSRRMEERLIELFEKGYVKGTVTISMGNEATAIGMALPFRPGKDPISLLHRDFGGHLAQEATPYQLMCQYMANADSPTHGREGNVHHGAAHLRRFPMISHLGRMLSLVVGATWAARRNGEDVFGLAAIGDGGSSTGEFHEALNIASVRKSPTLFLIENNHYSFSTPTCFQYNCAQLSDRAVAYGISGKTIDGTDPWEVYRAVCEALDAMSAKPMPAIIECMSLRMMGHAVYDKAEYITPQEREENQRRDPLPRARKALQEVGGMTETAIAALEAEVEEEVQEAISKAMKISRPEPHRQSWSVYKEEPAPRVAPYKAAKAKNGDAINQALAFILENNPKSFMAGLDIGPYGSAFKTCKGLAARFGTDRVIDMPISESGITGFALGASQAGGRPIVEYQFADFSMEAATQIGLNSATWFFRSGQAAPILLRLPCGGGLALGAFHSGEYEGVWSRFPGLKILYPFTPQECYEAILAGFYDPNPCIVLEHKLLYWSRSKEIDFDGDLSAVWRSRRYTEGVEVTLVAFGAMLEQALKAVARSGRSVEVWNPFVLAPLDIEPILESVARTGRLLVVQECGETQGLGDRLISLVAREGLSMLISPPELIAAPDVPLPFAPELEFYCLPNEEKILAAIKRLLGDRQ